MLAWVARLCAVTERVSGLTLGVCRAPLDGIDRAGGLCSDRRRDGCTIGTKSSACVFACRQGTVRHARNRVLYLTSIRLRGRVVPHLQMVGNSWRNVVIGFRHQAASARWNQIAARARARRDTDGAKKFRPRPRTPARRILCDQHRRTVAYSVPN